MATKKGTFQDYQGNELCPDLPAQELLNKIKTVDGLGSGLDADLLDGKQASEFAASNHTHTRRALERQRQVIPIPQAVSGQRQPVTVTLPVRSLPVSCRPVSWPPAAQTIPPAACGTLKQVPPICLPVPALWPVARSIWSTNDEVRRWQRTCILALKGRREKQKRYMLVLAALPVR